MKSYSLKWLTANTKEIAAFGTVVALSMVSLTSTAQARLIFTTEDDGVNADAYHLDIDDTSPDFIDLAFGSGLTSTLRYDVLNTKFIFNQNVEFSGKELSNFVVENQATGNAPTCNGAYSGGLYYDTTTKDLYYCDGTTWVSSSAPADNSIGSAQIIDGSITAADLGTNSVNSDEIATGAVTTDEILDGTIATADIAAGAITGGTGGVIADGSITAADLGTDSVDSDEIAADAVTASEIATGAVTTDEILDGTITNADLASNSVNSGNIVDGSITAADLGTNSVNSDEIAADAVTASEIATGAVTTDEILDGTIAAADLAAGSVSGGTGGTIADNTITAADVATGAITSDEILDGTITTSDIASGGNDKLLSTDGTGNVTWIDKSSLVSPTLTDAQMIIGDASGNHTAVDITGDISITNTGVTSLAANSVDSAEIATDAVTASEIATGAVTTDEILDGTIAAADLGADSVTATKINADVAGAGLTQNAGTGALEVDITNIGDGTTIDDNGAGALEVVDGSITSAKITDGTIATADIAAGAITGGTGGVIADGSITAADLGTDSVDSDEIAADAVTASEIATGAVTTDEILDGTIATADLADNSVTSAKIVDGTIVLDDIAERSFTEVIAPEFPDFTIQADGSNNRGRLQSDHDNTNNKNYYDWSTRKTALQDYDLIFQWTVPEGFQSFDTNSMAFEYKTTAAATTENSVELVEVKDTTGTTVAGATVAASASTTWTDSTSVDLTSGTYTPGERVTLRFKMSSKYSGGRQLAQLGAVKFTYNLK